MLYSILSKKGNIELKDVKSIGELLSEYISNAEMNPSINKEIIRFTALDLE